MTSLVAIAASFIERCGHWTYSVITTAMVWHSSV